MALNVCRKTHEDLSLMFIPRKVFFMIFVGGNMQAMLHKNFSGKFGKIWSKILCTPQNLPAPTPMPLATTGL